MELSFFFKDRFSGVASSGAESTSRSDSGELGGPLWDGERFKGIEKGFGFNLGLLGDSDPELSWSVSVDIRARFGPTEKQK